MTQPNGSSITKVWMHLKNNQEEFFSKGSLSNQVGLNSTTCEVVLDALYKSGYLERLVISGKPNYRFKTRSQQDEQPLAQAI